MRELAAGFRGGGGGAFSYDSLWDPRMQNKIGKMMPSDNVHA